MKAFAVDTLEFAEQLQKAGMTKKIAQTLAKQINQAGQEYVGNLATKNDLKLVQKDIETVKKDIENVRTELKGEISEVRTELKGDIKSVRQEIKTAMYTTIVAMGTMITIAVGVVTWLDKIIQ